MILFFWDLLTSTESRIVNFKLIIFYQFGSIFRKKEHGFKVLLPFFFEIILTITFLYRKASELFRQLYIKNRRYSEFLIILLNKYLEMKYIRKKLKNTTVKILKKNSKNKDNNSSLNNV